MKDTHISTISDKQLTQAIQDYADDRLPPSCYEPTRAEGWCLDISKEFQEHLIRAGVGNCITVEDIDRGDGCIHTVNRVIAGGIDLVVDWTARQYDPDVEVPHVEPWAIWEARNFRYGNISWFKNAEEWCADCGYLIDYPEHKRLHQEATRQRYPQG